MTKKDNVDFKISAQCRICKKAKKKKNVEQILINQFILE